MAERRPIQLLERDLLSQRLEAGDTLCLAVEKEQLVLRPEKKQV